MALYLVVAHAAVKTFKGGGNAMVVSAEDATDAKAIAASRYGGDSAWSDATVTELTEVTAATANAFVDWVFTLIIFTATPKTFTFTGTAANDTLDEVAAQLVILLNADADIAGAAYNATTQVLTVAAGTGVDDLGDMALTISITPPAVSDSGGQTNAPQNIAGLVSSTTDEGVSTDDLEVTFNADTTIVPAVKAVHKTT